MPAFTTEDILLTLGNAYYDVVPSEYRTYCVLNSKICQRVLAHFGIAAKVVPCQIWYVDASHNYAIGFLKDTAPNRWPGHAICIADNWLIDAALYHFKREFNLDTPHVVVAKTFGVASTVISRFDLGKIERLWWHQPPPGIVIDMPAEPEDVVQRLARELIQRVESLLHTRRLTHNMVWMDSTMSGNPS